MAFDAEEMRVLKESLERRTKTLEELADAAARQASADERLADAYIAAVEAGWTKAELSDAGVKEPALVRTRRRDAEKNKREDDCPGDVNYEN